MCLCLVLCPPHNLFVFIRILAQVSPSIEKAFLFNVVGPTCSTTMGKRGATPPDGHAPKKRGRRPFLHEIRDDPPPQDNPGQPGSSSDTGQAQCALTLLLFREVLWGSMSAALANRIANAAIRSGADTADIKRLAKCGASGKHPGNVWRELKTRTMSSIFAGAWAKVRMPLQRMGRVFYHDVGILYPHIVLSTLYHKCRSQFVSKILGGSEANISAFWDSMAQQPQHPEFAGHPMHQHPRYSFRRRAVPISIHGDGTMTIGLGNAWGKMADAISWSSCLAKGNSTVLSHIVILFMLEGLMCSAAAGHITDEAYWKEVTWSLYWAFQGVYPDRGSDGVLYTHGPDFERRLTPLADGFFLVLWVISGDLDYMTSKIKLANYRSSCSLCLANSTTLPWTDCRERLACWIRTIWSSTAWLRSPGVKHRIFKHVPGVGIVMYIPDVMHCKCLGSDPSFLGSVMRFLTHFLLPNDPETNLKTIWADIRSEYRRMRKCPRYGRITHNMIHPPKNKTPNLKGKAATVRAFQPVLIEVFKKHMSPANEQHRDMLVAMQASKRIDDTLAAYKYAARFPPEVSERFRSDCYTFCQCQHALVLHFHPAVPLFNATIKSHYLAHIGLIGGFINPSLGACWGGEDLMQSVRRLIVSSSNGSSPQVAQLTAMEKYVSALGFEMVHESDF